MAHTAKADLYPKKAKQLTSHQIKVLEDYYRSEYVADATIDLKFRFIKVFGIDLSQNHPKWIRLDRYVNRKRITNQDLKKYILHMFDEHFIPIRIFQSGSEWLAPDKINSPNPIQQRIIRSGMMIFEHDETLEGSIKLAQELDLLLEGQKYYVFSGNQSVHTWWMDYDFREFLRYPVSETKIWSGLNREKYDKMARKNALLHFQDKVNHSIDDRPVVDTRRIVPVINTLNGFTGRRVVLIDDILSIHAGDLRSTTILPNW